MPVYFVRHATPIEGPEEITDGKKKDVPLSANAENEVKAWVEGHGIKPDVIVYAPALRVEQTAMQIRSLLKAILVMDETWEEINFKYLDSLEPDSEEVLKTKKYFEGQLERLERTYKDKTVVVVTHGGVIKFISKYIDRNQPIAKVNPLQVYTRDT